MYINLFISKRFFDRYQILFLEFRLESNKKIEYNETKKKLLFNSSNSCYKLKVQELLNSCNALVNIFTKKLLCHIHMGARILFTIFFLPKKLMLNVFSCFSLSIFSCHYSFTSKNFVLFVPQKQKSLELL